MAVIDCSRDLALAGQFGPPPRAVNRPGFAGDHLATREQSPNRCARFLISGGVTVLRLQAFGSLKSTTLQFDFWVFLTFEEW
jgi:hypothetical protein